MWNCLWWSLPILRILTIICVIFSLLCLTVTDVKTVWVSLKASRVLTTSFLIENMYRWSLFWVLNQHQESNSLLCISNFITTLDYFLQQYSVYSRLRVVPNFGDSDRGVGENTHTRALNSGETRRDGISRARVYFRLPHNRYRQN